MGSKLSVLQTEQAACKSVSMNLSKADYSLKAKQFKGKAAVITLGCAKNQVDSEVMLGVLKNYGYEIVTDVALAEVAIINTCGFLESAIKESIDCILAVADHKKTGRLRRLLVAGCLVERYKGDIKTTLPEVDAFVSVDDILKVGQMAEGQVGSALDQAARPYFLYDDSMPRFLASMPHTAYVKISDGCNRPCTFCIIPKIRGSMRSRAIQSIVREVESLSQQGVKEVNLVAQDATSFGLDIGKDNLSDLLLTLDRETSINWIRLLYAYPIGIDQRLLATIAEGSRICKYLDLPLQHSSDELLKLMQRPLGRYSPKKIVDFIRQQQSGISLRTTFIVGFPGETEQDIQDLELFVQQGHFSSVGVFTYSPEPGTPAHDMSAQVDAKEKEYRRERIMQAQQSVVQKRLQGLVGTKQQVLIDGQHEETDMLLVARTEFQAPEVDGVVIINDSNTELPGIGQMCTAEITGSAGYDLVGRVV